VLRALARNYCREAGVRSLNQHIERIVRKTALQVCVCVGVRVLCGHVT
jgi:ATP-dependent Lon protease